MILGIDGRLANALRPAGAGRYCRELLCALAATECDITLRVYLDAPPREGFPAHGADIRVLPAGRFWTHRILAKELRHDPPDVFFSPVAQVPWRCPCRALVTVLDLAAWSHPESFPWTKRMAMRLQAGHAIRRADHIIAISASTAEDLIRRFGLTSKAVTVAHLGCDARFFDPVAPDVASILDTLPERFVLYVGQVQPRKNLERLMVAFSRVVESHPQLPQHLVLAGGQGWQNDAIYRAAASSSVADRIHFVDFIPNAWLPAMMARADVLALVSLWEGFGLPVLEAMATGTAVLASNCSSLPEVVGDAGVLVDPMDVTSIAEGLAGLLLADDRRAIYEKRGRERAAKFRWETTAATIAASARKLVDD